MQTNGQHLVYGDDRVIEDWPQSSSYYDPLTMDSHNILSLVTHDTSYRTPWHLVYTFVNKGQATTRVTNAFDTQSTGIFSPRVMESQLIIVHVEQGRTWGLRSSTKTRSSKSTLSLDAITWRALLARYDVLHSFVELLHSNTGGSFSWISYAREDSSLTANGTENQSKSDPIAFHVGYKIGGWIGQEKAIYAPQDLRTRRSFILVMGTETERTSEDRIYRLLHDVPEATMFHVVYALRTEAYNVTDKIRWEVEYSTQEFEKMTCIGPWQNYGERPLDEQELSFNRKLEVAVGFARNTAFGSARLRLCCQGFQTHLTEYCDLRKNAVASDAGLASLFDVRRLSHTVDTIIELSRHQYDQIQELLSRLLAQADTTRTLMAQRDTQLNIEMAKAMKKDSELMRGIAFITMIFLLATFAATFFSMVFFHRQGLSEAELVVDMKIWWYMAVVMPLTVAVLVWYAGGAFLVTAIGPGVVFPIWGSLKSLLGHHTQPEDVSVRSDINVALQPEFQAYNVAGDGIMRKEWPYLRAIAKQCSAKVEV